MECNKDEASRAKSIAERKLEQKDYFGAKKFALKAQSLYPGLEGISQILTTLDVYISAESKTSGEVDWYKVLNVNPSADDDTIKRQYRKLALLLHPDKNSSVGADGAFKLISEAWSLLSDKAKRLAYNQRRGNKVCQQNVRRHTSGPPAPPRPSQQKVPSRTGGPSAPPWPSQQKVPKHSGCPSAQYKSSRQKIPTHAGGPSAPSKPNQQKVPKHVGGTKSQNRSAKVPKKPPPAPPNQRTDTFWTTCGRCNTQYEYVKIYCNCTLLCQHCQMPFMALETARPVNYSRSANLWRRRSSVNNVAGQNAYDPVRNVPAGQKSGMDQASPHSFTDGKDQRGPVPLKADIGSTEPSVAAKVNIHVDELKRQHTEPNGADDWERCFKKRKLGDDSSGYEMNASNAKEDIGPETAHAAGLGSCGISDTNHQAKLTRELTPSETRKLLMVTAQKEIGEKMSDPRAESDEEKNGKNSNIQGHDGKNENESSTRTTEHAEKHWASPSTDNTRKEHPKAVIIDVPDSDFHNFDDDRSESSFSDNQIWAAYDNEDGMPRLYALIHEVVSRDPFELKISWLSSNTNAELSTINWVSSGFSKTCGEFILCRHQTCTSINTFSQRLHWRKGKSGNITILPQKGDSWAVYRNWSSDWNDQTPDDVVQKYDMVMVLDDYSVEQGVSVAPLVKVGGFSTVFLPNLEPSGIKRIPKEEMFRFSHRVPHHFLSREEAPDAPEGSVELDPAATPLELIQTVAENGGV